MGLNSTSKKYKRRFVSVVDFSLEKLNERVVEKSEKNSGKIIEKMLTYKTRDGINIYMQPMIVFVEDKEDEKT